MRSHCPLPNSYWRGGRTRGYCKAKRTFLARKTKLANRLSLKISQWLIGHFLKIGLISGFVFFICVFSKQLMVNKIGDDWIRTADLRCRKRPRYQLCYKHWSIFIGCNVEHCSLQDIKARICSSGKLLCLWTYKAIETVYKGNKKICLTIGQIRRAFTSFN